MKKTLSPKEMYDKHNTVKVTIKLNLNTDKDILDYLDKSGNKQGTIKRLIREDMARINS